MRLDEFQTQHGRMDLRSRGAAFQDIAYRLEVAFALRHFFAFHHQKASMHPEAGKRIFAGRTTGLSDLTFMMREDQIFTARVNIDHVAAQTFASHARTLDVPAGIASAPW